MKGMDMTEGKVLPLMVRFAIPLMLGDLFQQLYIATDSAIIGQFAGGSALAAVGSTTFLIRLIIGLFVGISAGASVVIAQSAGAKDAKKLGASVHTMAGLTLFGGVLLTVFGIAVAVPLLRVVATPAEIMEEATIYLRIYFAGSLFNLIYNVGSGILRSVGDAKRPFLYLVASSVVNVILDILFIAVIPMGTAGAALATILAQAVSAVLVISSMVKTKETYHLDIRSIRIQKELVPEILRMGLPAGLQSMIVALSNVIIQANINAMGTAVVAGFGVFNKVDGVIMLPLSSVAMAAMTFTGQNFGAGRKKRIVRGIGAMLFLEMAGWFIGLVICLLFGNQIFYIFTDDADIIYYAKMTMWYDIPCYWGLGIGYAMTCVIRGMGKSRAASFLFIFNMCIARQIWIIIVKALGYGLGGILLSYPVSWVLTLAGTFLYALYLKKQGEFDEVQKNESKTERARILCLLQRN